MSDFLATIDTVNRSRFGSPYQPDSGTHNHGMTSTPGSNDEARDPFAQQRQNHRDVANSGEEALRHRLPRQQVQEATTTMTSRELSFQEFRTAVEGLIAARPALEALDLPNLLQFGACVTVFLYNGYAHEALQKVELKADLLVIICEVRQHRHALVQQWTVSKEMKDYLRQLISELLRAHDLFAYKLKFGDRARKYIEKVERDAGTTIFAAAWTLDPVMKTTLMKEIEYEAGQERSNLKGLIEKAILNEWDIVRLTVAAVSGFNIRPSAELQRRLAFLRSFFDRQHGPFTSKDFWNKIDAKLNEVRKGGAAEIDKFYTQWFTWDIQKWPVQPESRDALRDVETLSAGL
ncbi:hypothetical protein BT69DRAFT_1319256 [Atractiella rhizophila]|nr:hypothetical protein BT69DRAFT_1319256 [Atractiella rhizophila]